jgi:hypothetical protein
MLWISIQRRTGKHLRNERTNTKAPSPSSLPWIFSGRDLMFKNSSGRCKSRKTQVDDNGKSYGYQEINL